MNTTSCRKPAVFMITSSDWKNGLLLPPTFVKSQAESLHPAGFDVFLTIVDDRTSIHGVLRNVRRIRSEIHDLKPNIVHAQYGSVTAAIASWVKGSLPLIVSFCGDDLLGVPMPGLVWRVREQCGRAIGLWAARRATTIIVKSQELLRALPPDLQRRAVVLPNGVDMKTFRPMDRDECRVKLNWDKKSKIILFDGSWNNRSDDQSRKNPALAEAAVNLLQKSTPEVELRKISNVAHEKIPVMMNAADCLLVTSLQEGSPNIVKEAMACNLPIVSVECGDVSERLKATTPGEICPYDSHMLAKAVQRVLLTGIRSNGRDQIKAQCLAAKIVAARLAQIYSQSFGDERFQPLNASQSK